MSDKFKQERAANVTKPGEKPLDPDLFETRPSYPAPHEEGLDLEQSQTTTGKTDGAKNERAPNVTKPGEQPIDPDKFDGEKGADRIEGTSSYNAVKSGKIEFLSNSTYLSLADAETYVGDTEKLDLNQNSPGQYGLKKKSRL